MAHHITWHTPNHILRVQAWGNVSALEVTMLGVKLWNMCDKGTAPVYVVFDVSQVRILNAVIPVIVDSSRYTRHPHFGAQFMLNPTPAGIEYITDLQSVTYYPMHFVKNMDEALEQIRAFKHSQPSNV